MSRFELPTLLFGEDPSRLCPVPLAKTDLSRLAADLCRPLAGRPGTLVGSPGVIGHGPGSDHFVVPSEAIVHFAEKGGALRYSGHLAARPRARSNPIHAALDWSGGRKDPGPLELLALPAKGACGVGFLAGRERFVVWHLGPSKTLGESDPTTCWLEAVQRAFDGPRNALLSVLEAVRADCDDAGDPATLAGALAEIAGGRPRLFAYFEDKVVDHDRRRDDPDRWRQRPTPYAGHPWQPTVVRYANPHPCDIMDVFLRLRYGGHGHLAGVGVVLRVMRPGAGEIPAPPDCKGQHWFRFELELET